MSDGKTLQVKLHSSQLKIRNSDKRFRIIAAGRRFGKSRLAAWELLIHALQSTTKDVWYIAPTYQQATDIMWSMLKELGHEVIAQAYEQTKVLVLVNGRKIALKGADRPDTLRGVGLYFIVIDEYADIKPDVWEQILRPALSDVQGRAMFIGTPKGRNHFFQLYTYAKTANDPEWEAFHFTSFDNPHIPDSEISAAKSSMSSFAFNQEFMASFEAASRDVFKPEWVEYDDDEPEDGSYFIACDLAGFTQEDKQSNAKIKNLDESALAVVKVGSQGWWVAEIVSGRWGVKETAEKILNVAIKYNPTVLAIEKGALKNAVLPYISELQRRHNRYFRIDEVTHGNQKKTDRIVWALQGRFEHGKIKLATGDWNMKFIDQLTNFPNSQIHDDLVDALAYIDQVQSLNLPFEVETEEFEVYDEISGY
jgi:predicted phage terminase large subunit-like protein